MQRTLYSLLAVSGTLLAQAQLAPGTRATLQQHMTEVNAEWRAMDPAPADGARAVHFTNDAERIATHLHRVRTFLMAHTPEGLSASAMAQRTFLLDKLDTYADRGVFPMNTVLPYRNPVFIDPVGTACAVGQLMIESGRADLAQRIHEEMNLAYVHDMHRSDVDNWAVEHGFTEDELAWIQPGYAPSVPWATLGGGTNNVVTTMLRLSDGDLLVAGSFTQAGGITCDGVARWNGASYTAMGTIPDGSISCAIEFNGSIYLGGSFAAGTADLLKWSNGSWVPTAAFASKYAIVYDLHVLNGTLYAAGSHSGFAGVSDGVVKLVGNNWEPVGQPLNAPVQRLASLNGTLVCGGQFTGNDMTQNTDIMHVAYLSGNTWTQLGDGLNGNVFAFLERDGQLYAGGDCVGEVTTYFGLARVATTSQDWEMLMPNIGNYMFSPLDGVVSILDIVARDTSIYLGGDFYCSEMMVNGAGVAVFNGTPDDVHPFCDFGNAQDLEFYGAHDLVAGGSSAIYNNMAITDLTTGIGDHGERTETLAVWPNPATDRLTITLPSTDTRTAEVLDASGRVVLSTPVRINSSTLNVSALADGAYTVRLTGDKVVRTARFVKH